MKIIYLTREKQTIVDDVDFEELNQYKWSALKGTNTYYAVRNSPKIKGVSYHIIMHREILGLTKGDGKFADHINGDGLDNRRENLRVASHSQNNRNRRIGKNNKTGYKGVHFNSRQKRYEMTINSLFDTAEEAARAYDKVAKVLYGEFAWLNFPEGENK